MNKDGNNDLAKLQLFYNESVRQYDLERDSYNTLTGKANSLLILNTVALLLSTVALTQIVGNFLSFLFIIPYAFWILSLWRSVESYTVSALMTVDVRAFVEDFFHYSHEDILKQLISNISGEVDDNKKVSIKRMGLINSSLMFFKYGLVSLACVLFCFLFGYLYF